MERWPLLSSCTQRSLLFALRPANTLHLAQRCTLLFQFLTLSPGPGAYEEVSQSAEGASAFARTGSVEAQTIETARAPILVL